MNVLFGRLSPCPYDEGEQDGDDVSFVHIRFVLFQFLF